MVAFLPLFAQAGLLNQVLSQVQHANKNYPQFQNGDFRLSHQIMSDKDEGLWVPSMKSTFNYFDSHPSRVESMLMYGWDEGAWGDPVVYYDFEYNAAGLVINSTMNVTMESEMVPFMRTESVFDSQNRITRHETFTIDFMDFETWILDSWIDFEYGSNNEFEIYSWDDYEGYDQYYHSTFSYDSSGRITEEISSVSMDSENWTFDTRDLSTYHPQDNSTGADFIAYISSIYGSTFFLMDWNIPILVASDTSYLWEDGAWVPDYRTIWEYDGSLRRIRVDDDNWVTDEWVTEYKTFYTYDANDNLTNSITQYSYAGTWEDESKTEYFWDSYTSSDDLVQEVIPAIEIKAWPMPFSESLNISTTAKSVGTPQISIYNSRGQIIREFTGSDQITWDGKDSRGRDSANGIYFIRAKQDKASAISKVIRVK